MALERGRFGIEYNPRQMRREPSGLGWVFAVIALVALISFIWTLIGRFRTQRENAQLAQTLSPVPVAEEIVAVSNAAPAAVVEPIAPPLITQDAYSKRPVKVKNLMMRLEEAERMRDVEMAVSTIETIRALPGSPAADIDDHLARRLGTLNVRRLFNKRNAQWVKQVVVKRGDSASRIASENGSTLASMVKLNGGSVDKIVTGSKLYVMDHPRFNLVVHRRSRTADLSLNGKFFKRYDLLGAVKAKEGAYELVEKKRQFWANLGLQFSVADRTELETLMPVKASILISEM